MADIDNSTMKNHGCAIIESVHHSGRPILVVATKRSEERKGKTQSLEKYNARLLNNQLVLILGLRSEFQYTGSLVPKAPWREPHRNLISPS